MEPEIPYRPMIFQPRHRFSSFTVIKDDFGTFDVDILAQKNEVSDKTNQLIGHLIIMNQPELFLKSSAGHVNEWL